MPADRPTISRPARAPDAHVPPKVRRGRSTSAKHSPKKPNRIDQHVAGRLRVRRLLVGISQDELAKRLGLTSQQVQKYEAGETRISASRLYDIARLLAVPITWFFDDLDEDRLPKRPPIADAPRETDEQNLTKLIMRSEARQLVKLYFEITDERLRKKVMEVANVLKKADST